MDRIKVVSIMRGIAKKSGKPYTRLVLKGIRDDGTRCVETFFVLEEGAFESFDGLCFLDLLFLCSILSLTCLLQS